MTEVETEKIRVFNDEKDGHNECDIFSDSESDSSSQNEATEPKSVQSNTENILILSNDFTENAEKFISNQTIHEVEKDNKCETDIMILKNNENENNVEKIAVDEGQVNINGYKSPAIVENTESQVEGTTSCKNHEEDDIVTIKEIRVDRAESVFDTVNEEKIEDDENKNITKVKRRSSEHLLSSLGEPASKTCKTNDIPVCEESEVNDEAGSESQNSGHETAGRKGSSKLVDYQVQCVNLYCKSGYGLTEAPVFVITYFGAKRKKNVLQKVCEDCFQLAFEHQQRLAYRLKTRMPLFTAEFPREADDIVVMDPMEEAYEEESLPETVIQKVEDIPKIIEETLQKYDVDYQWDQAENILTDKYKELLDTNKSINSLLNSIERSLHVKRIIMYKDFTPKIRSLPSLNIIEPTKYMSNPKSVLKVKSVAVKKVFTLPKGTLPAKKFSPPKETVSHDIYSVEEVEVPQNQLPPIGTLTYPILSVGDSVFVMKISFIGIWVKGKITEVIVRSPDHPPGYRVRFDASHRAGFSKVVSGKHLAYSKPSPVRYPVGTRVIALFKDTDVPTKVAYYVGLIAEPPKHINKFRYLVFFDDGYAQYVPHEKILQVCEFSRFIHEDIHPESRDFIKKYLDQYPERPMVKLQQGQIVRTEWNGKWWIARVVEVDASLVKMYFDADGRTEWIYRGSSRLGPLYSELIAAAARKEQGGLSRHRSLGIASLKKRNMPYVEYSVDRDDVKIPSVATGTSKNVAKKSTASKTNSLESPIEKCEGPPKPSEKMEHVSKGYIRSIDLTNRIPGRVFSPHQCGRSCIEWTNFTDSYNKGINPLALPLFFGFERQTYKVKGKRGIMYRAPCGRRLRNMTEVHRYLRITKSAMGLDLFDFDQRIHVLDEFHLESDMYCTHVKDISYGRENNIVSCVNEIDHSWPSFMDYSTQRLPQGGVNICLDEEFLVCCDCTDDCQDKEKCECWQLTIEGTKLGPEGVADPTVGYQNKRLLEPVTTGIYECNQRCKCASTCLNRVAQHPLQLNVQVFRTLKKGWGLRALNDIPQGCFICIYAGRLHTEQSANDDGRMYGDEYLAELDYIEVVERFKEGYESEVIEPKEDSEEEEEDCEDPERDELQRKLVNNDVDYVPEGLNRLPQTQTVVNTRARRKKYSTEEKSESEGEKDKADVYSDDDLVNVVDVDDDDEMKKKPSKFTAAVSVDEDRPRKFKSVREMFGDGADDCYIMDANWSGNIGRYLNHSCQPNVFVQNVFVDTHDVRFPWVAFFALTHIKAGTELTWDYNYDVGSVPDKVLYCYCNNAECRGRLL